MPAPEITALRERAGRVQIDLDGTPWRAVPIDVAARSGLAVGRRLDRPLARDLARELRRHRAVAMGLRSLRSRDRSTREVESRLAAAAVGADARAAAIAALARTGALDDSRFALNRAVALADRGWGNTAICVELERAGVAAELVAEALNELEPERTRLDRIVAARGATPKTMRYLAARGFDSQAVAEAAAAIAAGG